jgi:hypothetical protein
MKTLRVVLLCFFTGLFLGYLGAWVDHQEDISEYGLNGSGVSHAEIYPFWEWITAPLALPGVMTALVRHPQDWCIDEEWDYRWDITIGNGCGYALVCFVFLVGRSLVKLAWRKIDLRSTHAR